MNPEYAFLGLNESVKLPAGTKPIYFRPDEKLSEPVRTHIDLQFGIFGNFVMMHADCITRDLIEDKEDYFNRIMYEKGISTYVTQWNYGSIYPNDCGLCAAYTCYRGREYLICNSEATDRLLFSVAIESGYKHVQVKQGYSKCNCAVLSDGAVITEDAGIAKALEKEGIPCLLLFTKQVLLPGYEYGFIGGCTGLYRDTLYFNGCVEAHPEFEKMSLFASFHNTKLVSLGDYPLTDVGSIFFI